MTRASLSALNASIIALENVPGYRLITQCEVDRQPSSLNVSARGNYFEISPTFPSASGMDIGYEAKFPGLDTVTSPVDGDKYSHYIAFTPDGSRAYLGYIFNHPASITIPSMFGVVHESQFNLSQAQIDEPTPEKPGYVTQTNWSIHCNISRQEGFVNYTRHPGQPWKITHTSFKARKIVVYAPLKAWQVTLNYHAPLSTISGIGPAIGWTANENTFQDRSPSVLNWTVYALNYLYASGEAERIVYEVAARNISNDLPIYHYTVGATKKEQKYRITYIPIILVLGLASAVGAAALTAMLLFDARKSRSAQSMRQVDGLRLVVDSITGLQEWAHKVKDAGNMDEDKLKKMGVCM
ncbi:hypothetical protein BDW74DRAFT_154566 [Aspergillus multicolor]|uniref:uncharacterized protein n=1 Tax=Aspergillus multicolor TaxID=41759 RepID=UPI003CCCD676